MLLLTGLIKHIAPLGLIIWVAIFLQTFRPDGTKIAPLGAKCL